MVPRRSIQCVLCPISDAAFWRLGSAIAASSIASAGLTRHIVRSTKRENSGLHPATERGLSALTAAMPQTESLLAQLCGNPIQTH